MKQRIIDLLDQLAPEYLLYILELAESFVKVSAK